MIDLRCGDARDVLATLDDASVDAVVTDPPAGVSFMGKGWDGHKGGRDQWIAWLAGIMAEARRCVKPGGYALVWALPRTSHWTAMALEDAGWTIRDSVAHLFGSGFPKSQSCLKPAHETWWLAKAPGPLQPLQIDAARVGVDDGSRNRPPSKPSPTTYAQDSWTQDPAHRGPFEARGAGRWPPNTIFSHVGGPDGCQPAGVRRLPADMRGQGHPRGTFPHSDDAWGNGHLTYTGAETAGDGTQAQQDYRCVDGCPIKALDAQAGPRTSGGYPPEGAQRSHGATYGTPNERGEQRFTSSTGAASRYFPTFGPDPQDAAPFRYCSKASRREREAGLDDAARHDGGAYAGGAGLPGRTCINGQWVQTGTWQEPNRTPRANNHPTVKPTALMAWLCKLVIPEGGTVLDCFAGSGSTGVACVREGFGFIGIEQDAGYVEIMRARIAHEQERRDGQLALPLGHAYG